MRIMQDPWLIEGQPPAIVSSGGNLVTYNRTLFLDLRVEAKFRSMAFGIFELL